MKIPNSFLLALTVLASAGAGHAQFFAPPVTLTAGAYPTCAVALDVDGDGTLDLAVANSTSIYALTNPVTVLTNDGHGGFGLKATLDVGTTPYSLAVLDINGDGKPDLVSANLNANTLTVLTNDGHGGLALRQTLGTGVRPISVAAADVNGDGKADLICVNQSDNTLTVFINNGSDALVFSATLNVGNKPIFVLPVDVNADGKIDLVSADTYDNALTVLTNDGTGNFRFSATLSFGTWPYSIASADFNGDGKVDLVAANHGVVGMEDRTLTVLTNDGSGGFVTSTILTVGRGPFYVIATDVNRDGKPDLISADFVYNTLTVLTNDGTGGFVTNATINVGKQPRCVLAADLSGDGRLDLLSVNGYDSTLSLLLGLFPPPLAIQQTPTNTVLVSWPSPWSGFTLQTSGDLATGTWRDLTVAPADDGTNRSVTVTPLGKVFYRLKQ